MAVLPVDSDAFYAVVQSRVHEVWARFFGSTMKDDPCYFPSDCFETFPLPANWESDAALAAAGKLYYDWRRDIMLSNGEGLTKTYARFDNPDEESPNIIRLRELHENMDKAVLNAYGWAKIEARCEFVPEFDDEDGDDDGSRKKKKYVTAGLMTFAKKCSRCYSNLIVSGPAKKVRFCRPRNQ